MQMHQEAQTRKNLKFQMGFEPTTLRSVTRSRRVMGSKPIWNSGLSKFVFLHVFKTDIKMI